MSTRLLGRKSRGRRILLDPQIECRIVKAIYAGAFDWVAACAAGISRSTFYDWMQRGRAGEPPFSDFSDKVDQARAQARLAREIKVARTQPLAWLRYGPGRERPGEPGWTENHDLGRVADIPPPPKSKNFEAIADRILQDPEFARIATEFFAMLEGVEESPSDPHRTPYD